MGSVKKYCLNFWYTPHSKLPVVVVVDPEGHDWQVFDSSFSARYFPTGHATH